MKKKRVCIAALLGIAWAMGGCNSNDFSYNYLYCLNCSDSNGNCQTDQSQCDAGGCTTGNHTFTSQTDACNTLNSSSQNNGCDPDSRKTAFQNLGCSGDFTDN